MPATNPRKKRNRERCSYYVPDFIAIFIMPFEFAYLLNCTTKLSEKFDMAKLWATYCCPLTYNNS